MSQFVVTIPHPEAKYPDRISACAPRGLRAKVMRAAEAEGISAPDFIRRAVERHVEETLSGMTKVRTQRAAQFGEA